jgi:predicted nuclease of predicted toxin-antitoxin system
VSEVRFYLDEHAPAAVAKGLRRRGIDVLTVAEAKTGGQTDLQQITMATQLGRVLFTRDSDHLVIASKFAHCGIVYASRDLTIGECIRALELVHSIYSQEEMTGQIEFV